ncbi:MAG TPA: hypothetical protein VEI45_08705 [Mycobacterium sp.]|uniref:hypothetical protein n=1 Tax=Mycobacterium sp. TaxID=1785 RepID=UPI002D353562|nr:hypothetical protein [Mycobacterium sp.]HXY64413.1 hypothetical protein [Mycobacterium sp.]
MGEMGPLTRKVMQYQETVRQLVPTVKTAEDWAPLAALIAIDRFERIGTYLEVQNWQQYAEMLTGWANSVDSFETTVRRVNELSELVYFEIEERHFFGGHAHVVNSMSVFQFDADAKICHVAVYLQQAPPETTHRPGGATT